MLSIDVKDLDPREAYYYLIGGIGPRPIALVSTVSKDGKHNLAPFSFYNAFGGNPPMIGFSPARRGHDGTFKDTYLNIMETKECVVQAVNYSIVEQISLSSTEYPHGVDEFVKSGLTAVNSDLVKAKRVKESPFQMECKLHQMINLGDKGGAGNLAICEVLKFHISKEVMKNGRIDPYLIDLVGRNGGNFYTRANNDALFEIKKPIGKVCMGYDQLPDWIRGSETLSAKNLAMLAHAEKIPDEKEVDEFLKSFSEENPGLEIKSESISKYANEKNYSNMLHVILKLKQKSKLNPKEFKEALEKTIQVAILCNDIDFAWKLALLTKPKL